MYIKSVSNKVIVGYWMFFFFLALVKKIDLKSILSSVGLDHL